MISPRDDHPTSPATSDDAGGQPATAADDAFDAMVATGVVPEDMRVAFSEEALAQASRMAQEDAALATKPLRVYLEGKGCDGFFYGVAFDEVRAGDLRFEQGSLEIIVDPETLRFVCGSQVDWVDDERGRGFLVTNPQHRKYRGKFYKRRSWQELLERKTRERTASPPS
jgi:iron-sulfur cluster assembly accessory protein